MCSAFTVVCGYDNSTINLTGDLFCPNTSCSGKLCLYKTLFNLSAEAIINVRNARLCARCAIFILRIKQTTFSGRLVKGFTVFEESPKSIQNVNGEVFCPGKNCFNRENCESLDGYVTTPRPICRFGKCGACLFVHKVPFML